MVVSAGKKADLLRVGMLSSLREISMCIDVVDKVRDANNIIAISALSQDHLQELCRMYLLFCFLDPVLCSFDLGDC